MKSLSDLTEFYYGSLHPTLVELEKKRKQVKSKVIFVGMLMLIIDLLLITFLKNNLEWLFFINIAAGSMLYRYLVKDYSQEFKDKIISPLIHAIDSNLKYEKNRHVAEFKFINSGLFSTIPDKTDGNDYISGMIDGVNIEFSDLHAKKKNTDSHGKDSWSSVFQGLFIVSEFNKNFKGSTIVLPDVAQNSFGNLIGNWLQSHNANKGELIKMDSPEFEREFVVYGSNQIEARYILTHSLMQRLLEFKKKSKHKLYISFVFNHIYLAIDYGRDLFEPSVFKALLDYKVAMEYISTLHLAINIVDELKLNKKLWSKI